MSRKPYTYVMPEDFMSDQSVPAHWRLLGVLNGFFFNNKDVYASNAWFQEQLGCSQKTVSDAVGRLEELGLIHCTRTRTTRVIKKGGSNQLLGGVQPTTIPDSSQLLPNADSNADRELGVPPKYEIVKDEPTKPIRTKPVAEQVYTIFKEETGRSPLSWRTNKSQRQAAENLMAEWGADQIRKALQFHRENKDERYCPAIITPWDLDTKWAKLAEFRKKQNG